MPNVNVPRGLIPYRRYDNADFNASLNMYFLPAGYAVNLFIGDPLDVISTSNDANGIPAVILATVGNTQPFVGAFMGIVAGGEPQLAVTRDQPIYHPASTAQYCLVADDPNLLFEIQDSGGAQAIAPNLWAGANAALLSGAGSTVTGYSGWQLDATAINKSSANGQLRIVRPLPEPDVITSNVANTNMFSKWLVKINYHRLLSATSSA